jgi:hypothetical protein
MLGVQALTRDRGKGRFVLALGNPRKLGTAQRAHLIRKPGFLEKSDSRLSGLQ